MASTAPWSVVEVESFIHEYYEAWGGTNLDRVSYYTDDVMVQIPGVLMKGNEAVRDQFARPFITAFPGNHHLVKKRDVLHQAWSSLNGSPKGICKEVMAKNAA